MSSPVIPEITASELAHSVERGDDVQVLDVRLPEVVKSGRVDLVEDEHFFNLVGSRLMAMADPADLGIRRNAEVAVVCARGVASRNAARFLTEAGFRARSLAGGMAQWMMMSVERALPAPDGFDHFLQFDRVGKGALGYLLIRNGEGLVVDPPRDNAAFRAAAARLGARIVGVADTHVHADFISGSPALSAELGVPYYLHPSDHLYPYDGTPGRLDISELSDGASIPLGDASVTVRHTPGHTEGSVSFRAGSVVLTGDFIFVESIGRPDLGGKAEEWVGGLWDSISSARSDWSPDLTICPAHYSNDGERNPDRSIARPYGEILGAGGPASIEDRDEFFAWVLSRKSAFPEAYRQIKAINVGIATVTPEEADTLEIGKNECAVG